MDTMNCAGAGPVKLQKIKPGFKKKSDLGKTHSPVPSMRETSVMLHVNARDILEKLDV